MRNKGFLMLSKLPPRERQIVDILYERGPVAVSDICEALPDQLSGSAVRSFCSGADAIKQRRG